MAVDMSLAGGHLKLDSAGEPLSLPAAGSALDAEPAGESGAPLDGQNGCAPLGSAMAPDDEGEVGVPLGGDADLAVVPLPQPARRTSATAKAAHVLVWVICIPMLLEEHPRGLRVD
jgi:hypothetical protein